MGARRKAASSENEDTIEFAESPILLILLQYAGAHRSGVEKNWLGSVALLLLGSRIVQDSHDEVDQGYVLGRALQSWHTSSLAQTNPKKTAILTLIVFGTAPGLGAAAVPNEISGKAN